jgi:hypothetical protein
MQARAVARGVSRPIGRHRHVTSAGVTLPKGLREEIEDAIDSSQPAWDLLVEANREHPGSSAFSLAMKYVESERAGTYRAATNGLWIGSNYHTWGRGVYVTGVQEPLSTAIYGRIGIVARFDPTGWRCFDARDVQNRQLYLRWLHAQVDYPEAVLTVHTDFWLHSLRNLFREQFLIDVVLFAPDELDGASQYTSKDDTWMAVSDWTPGGTLVASGYSSRFVDVRLTVLLEEEFRADDPSLTRTALLRLGGGPGGGTTLAGRARTAYANRTIERVQS